MATAPRNYGQHVGIKIDLTELKRRIDILKLYMVTNYTKEVYGALQVIVNQARKNLRTQRAYDTGALIRSIKAKVIMANATGMIAAVGTDEGHGYWVEKGTGMYGPYKTRIYPHKPDGLLRWVDKRGKVHFAPYVKGMKPRPFLVPAVHEKFIDFVVLLAERFEYMLLNIGKSGNL